MLVVCWCVVIVFIPTCLPVCCDESPPSVDQGLQVSGELRAAQPFVMSVCPHVVCHPPTPQPPHPPSGTGSQHKCITSSQRLLLRSTSASLHSAYTRLTGLISKFHPFPGLQAASAAGLHLWRRAAPQPGPFVLDRHILGGGGLFLVSVLSTRSG